MPGWQRARRLAWMVSGVIVFLVSSAPIVADSLPELPFLFPSLSIILISWDGTDRSDIQHLLNGGDLPFLQELIARGTIVEIENVEITDTKPGHATMLTGYESEITRVVSNSDFDEIPPGLTLFERLEEYFGTVGIATAMVTSKKENLGTDPGKPFHNARKVLDFWDGDVHRSADESGPIMLEVIDLFKQLPFFAFFHFADPDTAGHLYGEGSWGYLDAIRECDKWLGLIVRQLEVYGIRQRTMVYVTTDHGFNPGAHFHWRAPHIFLATDDPNIKSRGTLRDIAPTVLLRYGVDVGIYSPRLLGIPLTTKEGSWR